MQGREEDKSQVSSNGLKVVYANTGLSPELDSVHLSATASLNPKNPNNIIYADINLLMATGYCSPSLSAIKFGTFPRNRYGSFSKRSLTAGRVYQTKSKVLLDKRRIISHWVPRNGKKLWWILWLAGGSNLLCKGRSQKFKRNFVSRCLVDGQISNRTEFIQITWLDVKQWIGSIHKRSQCKSQAIKIAISLGVKMSKLTKLGKSHSHVSLLLFELGHA